MVQRLVHAPDVLRSQPCRHWLDRFALAGQKQPRAVELQRINAIRVPCGFSQTAKISGQTLLPGA